MGKTRRLHGPRRQARDCAQSRTRRRGLLGRRLQQRFVASPTTCTGARGSPLLCRVVACVHRARLHTGVLFDCALGSTKSRAKGHWKKLKNAIDGGESRSSSLKAGLPSRKIAPASELESDGSDDQQQQPSERKLHSRSYKSSPDGSSKPSKMLRSKSLKLGRSGARLTDKAEDGPCMHLLVGSFPVRIVPVPP